MSDNVETAENVVETAENVVNIESVRITSFENVIEENEEEDELSENFSSIPTPKSIITSDTIPTLVTEKPVINVKECDNDDTYTQSFVSLKKRIQHMEVNAQNLMIIMRYAMEIVELTQLKGEEQKQLVIRLLKQVVIDAPISDDKEQLCLDMINNGVLGQSIDLIVDATRGNININNAVDLAQNCFCTIFKNFFSK